MSIFDIVVLVLLAFGAIGGFRKGFILEIIGILALILGIFGAIVLLQAGMEIMQDQFEVNSQLLPYITFLVLFILIILGVNLIGRLIKTVIHLTPLGVIDYIGGAIIGTLKWAVAISFILWISTSLGFTFILPEEDSFLYDYISKIAPWIVDKVDIISPFIENDPPETKQAFLFY